MPALLITGRSGSGKTEVARAVARSMQHDAHAHPCESIRLVNLSSPLDIAIFDYDVDVRYVDLTRYKERPARSLGELFAALRDAVAWRAPGVLILDNLDAILGAEVEVCL